MQLQEIKTTIVNLEDNLCSEHNYFSQQDDKIVVYNIKLIKDTCIFPV